jgi:hypothetical protein
MFEVQGDLQPRRFVFYECLASRPSVDAATVKGSIEPSTDTLSFVATPRQAVGMVKAVLVKTVENETAYTGFYTSVYEFAGLPNNKHRTRNRIVQIQQHRQPIGGDTQEQRLPWQRSGLSQDFVQAGRGRQRLAANRSF